MRDLKRILGAIGLMSIFSTALFAQSNGINRVNTITTAVPFLRIAPDARAGGMGDAGLATSPDPFSMHWNPSKVAFSDRDLALSFSYTPWLKELVDDINLAGLSGLKKLGDDQGLTFSLMYFSLGNIQFTDNNGQDIGTFSPNEFKADVGYARKLADNFSMGLSLRYIFSNLATGQITNGVQIKPGQAIAADISAYYRKELEVSGMPALLAFGGNISNIGSKITYTESTFKDFIPTNLGLGSYFRMEIDEYNDLGFAFDVNKLLVPTPDTVNFSHRAKSVPAGIFGSFNDAPAGFSEELQEFMFSIGAEYWYAKQFAVRGGYFYESPNKGNRRFITAGLGLKLNVFGLDVSYLVPTNSQRNPLDNTLRFTLSFDFDAIAGGGASSK